MLFTSRILSIVLLVTFAAQAAAETPPPLSPEKFRDLKAEMERMKALRDHENGGGGSSGGRAQLEKGWEIGNGKTPPNNLTGRFRFQRPALKAPAEKPLFTFPCEKELKAAKTLPKILLKGEMHGTDGAEKATDEGFERASQGKCIYSLEGVYCGGKEKLQVEALPKGVFGYDDAFTHGFATLLASFKKMRSSDPAEVAEAKINLTDTILANEFGREAWTEMLKVTPLEKLEENDPSEKAIADIFNILHKDPNGGADRIEAISKTHPFLTDDHAMQSILKRWIRAYTKMALSEKYVKKEHVPQKLNELVEDYLNSSDPLSAFVEIGVLWRNQYMAENLAALYCKELKKGIPLEVKTGSTHVEGLADLLTQMSGGLVSVEKEHVPTGSPEGELQRLEAILELQIYQLQRATGENKTSFLPPGRTGEVEEKSPFAGIGQDQYGGPPGRFDFTKPIENPYGKPELSPKSNED